MKILNGFDMFCRIKVFAVKVLQVKLKFLENF